MEKTRETEDTISLLDILLVLAKNLKMIFLVTLLSGVVIVVLSVLSLVLPPDAVFNFFPNKYKPEVTVLLEVPGDSQGGFSSLLSNSSELGSLVGMLGGATGGSSLGSLVQILMQNNEIIDRIAGEYNFKEKYGIEEYVRTNQRKIFIVKSAIEIDEVSNTVVISYEDTDPQFATDVVNSLVKEIEKKVKKIFIEQTEKKKALLDEMLTVKEAEYKQTQQKLVDFQKKYGIVDVQSQAQRNISLVAGFKADILEKEQRLKAMQMQTPQGSTEIEILKQELDASKKFVEELEQGGDDYSLDFIPLNNLPGLAAEYVNLQQDLTIQGVILQMLKEQSEAVKIELNDKSHTFNILQEAEVPELKDSPRRSIIVIVVTFAAFFIAVFIAFIREYLANVKKDPQESGKLASLKAVMPFIKKKAR